MEKLDLVPLTNPNNNRMDWITYVAICSDYFVDPNEVLEESLSIRQAIVSNDTEALRKALENEF
jgi:hypothetical protein